MSAVNGRPFVQGQAARQEAHGRAEVDRALTLILQLRPFSGDAWLQHPKVKLHRAVQAKVLRRAIPTQRRPEGEVSRVRAGRAPGHL